MGETDSPSPLHFDNLPSGSSLHQSWSSHVWSDLSTSSAIRPCFYLKAAWGQDRQLSSYPICWLSSVGDMVLDQAAVTLRVAFVAL